MFDTNVGTQTIIFITMFYSLLRDFRTYIKCCSHWRWSWKCSRSTRHSSYSYHFLEKTKR